MTVREFAEKIGLQTAVEADLDREITGGYCGDLLSWVMSRAQSGDCWFTVLCENAPLDDAAKLKAQQQDVNILLSEQNAYTLSAALSKLL